MSTTNRLREALKAADMQQQDLARALGVTDSAVSRLLSGKRSIKVATAARIVEILREKTGKRRGFSLDSIFGKAA